MTKAPVVMSAEWVDAVWCSDGGASADDVSITRDGRWLDSPDKVMAFFAEVQADVDAGHGLVAELP
jgi:hypothetical protein